MEAFAASLAFADNQIGRVVDYLRRSGQFDNTLVIYIQGDNGASAEGSFNGRIAEQSALNGFPEPLDYAESRADLLLGRVGTAGLRSRSLLEAPDAGVGSLF